MQNLSTDISRFSSMDLYLLHEGKHTRLYQLFGAHRSQLDGKDGCHFAVWAPNAHAVSVIGDFNGWHRQQHRLSQIHPHSGVWEGFIAGVDAGQHYKFHIESNLQNYKVDKSDPFAFACEPAPATASRVASLDYQWQDQAWMADRAKVNALDAPLAVYEVHLGSWRRSPDSPEQLLSYRDIAAPLADYCVAMNFTHVELLPLMEHPFYGSWGYQITGFFAASARYGSPQDLMFLIDHLHQRGIGVILDWVPSHFPNDQHGLAYFDGTALYEHADPRQGYHPEWKSQIFNYGRHEVRAFLLSSALFWMDKYHIDGLRVDAVASMLYLDYARKEGEWVPNVHGGRENIAAIEFMQLLNEAIYKDFPDTQTIAEESTSWPMVSRPNWLGGLGFGMKWNMGWMHDCLDYFSHDPIHRRYHHEQITFSIWYAFHENFMLPISHDEVVYGKGSLINKMPGDEWQRFANLRLLLAYMWGHPGKKLLFMGCEFAQIREWNHDISLDWHLLQHDTHRGVQQWLSDLNACYRQQPALYQRDFSNDGFQWVDCHDNEESVLTFLRRSNSGEVILVALNATPIVRDNYRIGVPQHGFWKELLNSDAHCYGGGGLGNCGGVHSTEQAHHGQAYSILVRLPPLAAVFMKIE